MNSDYTSSNFNSLAIKRSKQFVLLPLFFCHFFLAGQDLNDTLNKFSSKKKKDGYWVVYLDKNFSRCTKDSAKYYGFEYFNKGKLTRDLIGRSSDSITYRPFVQQNYKSDPQLLNGELQEYRYYKKQVHLHFSESVVNGKTTVFKQYFYSPADSSFDTDALYFDSLYQNIPHTLLYYKIDHNVPIYKEYYGDRKRLSERMFFVKAKEFDHLYRPVIGYFGSFLPPDDKTLKSKNFVELGFSRKNIRGYIIDSIGQKHPENLLSFSALNFSLLVSRTGGKVCLGQKLTYSRSIAFLKAEAGLLNFTDFQQTDLRLMLGLGFEIPCRFTYMLHFSVPIAGSKFKDIGTITAMIAID